MSILQETEEIRYSHQFEENNQAPNGKSVGLRPKPVDDRLKRFIDVVGAVSAIVLFLPVIVPIYIALMLSGGSPIFAHRRVGQSGDFFDCYKFRTMVKGADKAIEDYLNGNSAASEEWRRSFKLARDPRVTKLGTFLRRTSLDELPQLFNVLSGEMSLVGPRPIVPDEVERYANNIGLYYQCRPGITGLWQVSGRNLVAYDRRVALDAVYARNRSLRLDMIIMLRTVWVVLRGHGAC